MKRGAVLLVIAAACTVPEYNFAAPDAGGPDIQGRDSGPGGDDDDAAIGVPDADAATIEMPDAAPLPSTVMPNTADFTADCANFTFTDMGAAVLQDADASNHCVMFLHNATYRRTWLESKITCETITRGERHGHLAIFPNATKANNLIAKTNIFPGTLAAWIGLELKGDNAIDLASWIWLGGATTTAFNGWAPGHPAGAKCAGWAGASAAQWLDADCATPKGLLCEVDP